MEAIPWQTRFVRGVSRPGVRQAALSVSRSNGKSYVCSSLALDYLLGDKNDTEALVVSGDFRQAKIITAYMVQMLRERGFDLDDKSRWLVRNSVNQGMVRDRSTGITVRAMSSRPAGLYGRIFGMCLIDEPREIEPAQADDLLSAITSGTGKVPDTKVIGLGSMPADPLHWFRRWCEGEGDYVQVHQARPRRPPFLAS